MGTNNPMAGGNNKVYCAILCLPSTRWREQPQPTCNVTPHLMSPHVQCQPIQHVYHAMPRGSQVTNSPCHHPTIHCKSTTYTLSGSLINTSFSLTFPHYVTLYILMCILYSVHCTPQIQYGCILWLREIYDYCIIVLYCVSDLYTVVLVSCIRDGV